ncbi:NAD(P)-binding protein [Colwelliaceae bacterium 6441]
MKLENCVIAGGGICGIFASILLADKFKNVYVIEKEAECGGLLKSVKDDSGHIYDQGTHVPNTTLVPEIDEILFGKEQDRENDWFDLGRLRTGNYFCDKWNLITQIIDVRHLPSAIYQQGVMELLSLTEESTADDIVTYLCETLGPTFTTEAVAPIAKKLYGNEVDLSQLIKNSSVSYFGLNRVQALNSQVTKKLKELPAFDSKLAYHDEKSFEERITSEGIPQTTSYYPKNNQGVGFWVNFLLAQAKAKGVNFMTCESIQKINHQEKHITSILLGESGETLPCDFLFWTAPPIFALNAAGIKVKKRNVMFKSACIFHYTVDKPLLNDNAYYLWNWDVNYKGFRITLYPNMQGDMENKENKLTVEMLCSAQEVEDTSLEEMFKELQSSGIIDKDSNILGQLKQVIHNTFPVPTFEFDEAVQSNNETLTAAFDNVHLAGRFAGKSWFHQDVLKDVYFDINNMF